MVLFFSWIIAGTQSPGSDFNGSRSLERRDRNGRSTYAFYYPYFPG